MKERSTKGRVEDEGGLADGGGNGCGMWGGGAEGGKFEEVLKV